MLSDNPLHTKWLMANQLKEKGLKYTKGVFTCQEDEIIRETIRDYTARHNKPADMVENWFIDPSRGRDDKDELRPLWVEIAVRLKTRPLLNVYLHVRRMFHPQNNIGTWTKEDDAKLIEFYAKHKGQWTVIGRELGRIPDSCKDRYRNYLKDKNTMKRGTWTAEEDETMLNIMQDQAIDQGKKTILEAEPQWVVISAKMNGRRSRHQCRTRYIASLLTQLERGELAYTRAGAAIAAQKEAKESSRKSKSTLNDLSSDGNHKASASGSGLQGKIPRLRRATSSSQRILSIIQLIREEGYEDRAHIDYKVIAEKLEASIREYHQDLLKKLSTIIDQLKARKQKPNDGEEAALDAAIVAMTSALSVVQEESARLLHKQETAGEIHRKFVGLRLQSQHHGKTSFDEVLNIIAKDINDKLDDRTSRPVSRRLEPREPCPRSLGPMHHQHLVNVAHFAMLDGLLAAFPLLQQGVQKTGLISRRYELGLPAGDIEKAAEAVIRQDFSKKEQIMANLKDRTLAEKLISDAMVEAGLLPIAERRIYKSLYKGKKRETANPKPLVSSEFVLTDDEEYDSDDESDDGDETDADSDDD